MGAETARGSGPSPRIETSIAERNIARAAAALGSEPVSHAISTTT